MRTGTGLVRRLLAVAVYFTFSPSGPHLYVAIMKALGVRRIIHLHGKGVAANARGKRHLCE